MTKENARSWQWIGTPEHNSIKHDLKVWDILSYKVVYINSSHQIKA